MVNWITDLTSSSAFLNAFWIFIGIVAGAFIQHLLNRLTFRSQAKMALKVLQIEIAYNLSEVEAFEQHLRWLKDRISAGQISEDEMYFPMQRFDYSAIGPLMNAGYFHVLLGAARMKHYLEFNNFFRIVNGESLTMMLRTEHGRGKSLEMLEWVERRTKELKAGMADLEETRLDFRGTKLIAKK